MDGILTLLIFIGCAAVAISFSPIGGAIAARIRGQGGAAGVTPEVLAELDEVRARLAELEERADFAERVLPRTPAAPSSTHEARP